MKSNINYGVELLTHRGCSYTVYYLVQKIPLRDVFLLWVSLCPCKLTRIILRFPKMLYNKFCV